MFSYTVAILYQDETTFLASLFTIVPSRKEPNQC